MDEKVRISRIAIKHILQRIILITL